MHFHALHQFWIVFAIIRHPVAGVAALLGCGAIALVFRGRR